MLKRVSKRGAEGERHTKNLSGSADKELTTNMMWKSKRRKIAIRDQVIVSYISNS